MPTTSERRPISRLMRSSGFAPAQLAPVLGREAHEGEQVLLGRFEQPGDLGRRLLQGGDGGGEALARLSGALGGEDLADGTGNEWLVGLAAVAEHVPEEVHRASLPRTAEDLGDRALQALVGVGDGQLHAREAAGPQTAQELSPEGLGLGLADVDPDDLAVARFVDALGDDERLRAHAARLSDLLHLGVQPEIRVAALERPLAEDPYLLVETRAEPAHSAPAHARKAELGHEALDLARGDAVDVGLLHDRDQRLLRARPRPWGSWGSSCRCAAACQRRSQTDPPLPVSN